MTSFKIKNAVHLVALSVIISGNISYGQMGGHAFTFPRTTSQPVPLVTMPTLYLRSYQVGETVKTPYTIRELLTDPALSNHVLEYKKMGTSLWNTGDGSSFIHKKFGFNTYQGTWTTDVPGRYAVRVKINLPNGTTLMSPLAVFTLVPDALDLANSKISTVPQFESSPVSVSEYVEFLNWALDPDGLPLTDDGLVETGHNLAETAVISARLAGGMNYEIVDIDDDQCPIGWNNTAKAFTILSTSTGSDPVTEVSWYGAMLYAWAKNHRTNHDQTVNLRSWIMDLSLKGYRLPTETEWQVYGGTSSATIRHWCYDIYSKNTTGNHYQINPVGGAPFSVTKRVIRTPSTALRFSMPPDTTIEDVGFTLVRTTADILDPTDPDPDDDRDGMLDDWETHYFGGTNQPDGAADGDWDGDGFSNLSEYIAGTNPTNPASLYEITIVNTNGEIFVNYPAHAATGTLYQNKERYYDLFSTTNLLSDTWNLVAGQTNVLGNGIIHSHTNQGADPEKFFKINTRLEDR